MARLESSTPIDTLLDVNVKYQQDGGNLISYPTLHPKLVGSLVNVTITGLDIFMFVSSVGI